MRYRHRITRIEAYRRRRLPPRHFLMSVRVPWDLPEGMGQATWLAAEVRCPCGERGCPELRIGLVVPAKAPSVEAWAERAAAYYQRRLRYDVEVSAGQTRAARPTGWGTCPRGGFGCAGTTTMRNLHRRLDALQAARARRQRRMIAAMAADVGLTAEELLEEAEAFFALSLEDQLAKVDIIAEELRAEGLSMDDLDDLKATLTRHYRP